MNSYLYSFIRELNNRNNETDIEVETPEIYIKSKIIDKNKNKIKNKTITTLLNNTSFNRNKSMDDFMKFQWPWVI